MSKHDPKLAFITHAILSKHMYDISKINGTSMETTRTNRILCICTCNNMHQWIIMGCQLMHLVPDRNKCQNIFYTKHIHQSRIPTAEISKFIETFRLWLDGRYWSKQDSKSNRSLLTCYTTSPRANIGCLFFYWLGFFVCSRNFLGKREAEKYI